MLNLIVFIMICYGVSNMVVYSNGPFDIFVNFRALTNKIHEKLGELFSCMMCFPFWVGLSISAMDIFLLKSTVFTPLNMILMAEPISLVTILVILILDGAISSGTTWILHNIEEYFEFED